MTHVLDQEVELARSRSAALVAGLDEDREAAESYFLNVAWKSMSEEGHLYDQDGAIARGYGLLEAVVEAIGKRREEEKQV